MNEPHDYVLAVYVFSKGVATWICKSFKARSLIFGGVSITFCYANSLVLCHAFFLRNVTRVLANSGHCPPIRDVTCLSSNDFSYLTN